MKTFINKASSKKIRKDSTVANIYEVFIINFLNLKSLKNIRKIFFNLNKFI